MTGNTALMSVGASKLESLKQEVARLEAEHNDMARLSEVSDQVCRKILTALCEVDADIKTKAFSCLWAYKDNDRPRTSEGQESTVGAKRKVDDALPELFICKKCGDGFLEEDNEDEACFYHPEYLACDYDSSIWDDWPNGDPDIEENRKLYPKGFRWACCDEPGGGETGCEYERHEPTVVKRQKLSDKTPEPAVTVDLTKDD